jgi:hypothetical protein
MWYYLFMPPVNLFYSAEEFEPQIVEAVNPLRDHVAEQLSTREKVLARDEVSVRIIKCLGEGMLADLEMDILAAPHASRIERQDEICDSVRDFMLSQIPELRDAKVWLGLQELGYSFGR